jgi:hypothetical protein
VDGLVYVSSMVMLDCAGPLPLRLVYLYMLCEQIISE